MIHNKNKTKYNPIQLKKVKYNRVYTIMKCCIFSKNALSNPQSREVDIISNIIQSVEQMLGHYVPIKTCSELSTGYG